MARTAYIIGSIGLIVVGVMHIFVHVTHLATPDLQSQFEALGTVDLGQGPPASIWGMWMGFSLLMGFFSAALGATSLAALYRHSDKNHVPTAVAIVNMCMLLAIAILSYFYLSSLLIAGGVFGATMFAIAAFTTEKG